MSFLSVALMLLMSASLQVDASGVKEKFVGTWTLEVIEARDEAGEWEQAVGRFGNDPVGYIIYDSAGSMAVQVMRRDRPRFSSDDVEEATPEEATAAFQGYGAYFGTYDVDEKERFVTHHRKGHLMPNQVGVDAKRFYRFHGDRLTLTLPSRDVRLTWRRLR